MMLLKLMKEFLGFTRLIQLLPISKSNQKCTSLNELVSEESQRTML